MTPARLIATFGGVGDLRPAPGTLGSLAALPVAFVLFGIGGPWLLIAVTMLTFGIGLRAAQIEIAATGNPDPPEVVIDEVVGQWIALLPVALGAWQADVGMFALWPGWVLAFALFRLFDIWKPGPIGTADRRGDAMGLMLDDVLAGVAAGAAVVLLAAIWHAGPGG